MGFPQRCTGLGEVLGPGDDTDDGEGPRLESVGVLIGVSQRSGINLAGDMDSFSGGYFCVIKGLERAAAYTAYGEVLFVGTDMGNGFERTDSFCECKYSNGETGLDLSELDFVMGCGFAVFCV